MEDKKIGGDLNSKFAGVESVSIDMNEKKLTLLGSFKTKKILSY
jgi:hypothetical protein